MQPIGGRVFPLKHKKYRERGVWEYELSGGYRVFYIPMLENRTVLVYYAGEHPPQGQAPLLPKIGS